MIELCDEIATEVRKQRAVRNITKTKLSEELGISAQTLRKIEEGKKSVNSKTYQTITEWLIKELS